MSRLLQQTPAPGPARRPQPGAFTIIELLVGMTLFAVVLGIALSAVGTVTTVYKSTGADAESFHKARVAFASITDAVAGATLETYYGYEFPDHNTTKHPTRLTLKSDLHFLSGPVRNVFGTATGGGVRTPGHAVLFQAPAGYVDDTQRYGNLGGLLNVIGFYVEYGRGKSYAPPFLRETAADYDRFRFRLIQVTQPAENSEIFSSTSDDKYDTDWVKALSLNSPIRGDKHVLAENILAFVIRPKDPASPRGAPTDIAPDYNYDSRQWEKASSAGTVADSRRNTLPPVLEITMVSTDEHSAERIELLAPGNAPGFLGVSDLFRSASEASYRRDINRLRRKLDRENIPYRIFTTEIPLAQGGWTTTDPSSLVD